MAEYFEICGVRIPLAYDTNKDRKLSYNELSIWLTERKMQYQNGVISCAPLDKLKSGVEWCIEKLEDAKDYIVAKLVNGKTAIECTEEITVPLLKSSEPRKVNRDIDIRQLVAKEAASRETKLSDEQVNKWADLIIEMAEKYNIPAEIITVIISRECHFIDPKSMANGSGCMQITSSPARDFSMNCRGDSYKKLNESCYNDTIPNPKAYNPTTLHSKCHSDRKTCIKAGILTFDMAYANAVSKIKKISLSQAIDDLKNGSIELTEDEARAIMYVAMMNYNTVNDSTSYHDENGKKIEGVKTQAKVDYANDVLWRLDEMGYDYTKPLFEGIEITADRTSEEEIMELIQSIIAIPIIDDPDEVY